MIKSMSVMVGVSLRFDGLGVFISAGPKAFLFCYPEYTIFFPHRGDDRAATPADQGQRPAIAPFVLRTRWVSFRASSHST